MKKQIWQIGSNGYAVMRDNQISEQREFKYMQEREALKPYLILKYNITDIENPTKLVNSLNYIVEMIIDGQIVEPVTEFTFTTLGDHEVRFKYEDTALEDSQGMIGEFGSIEALTEIVKIPADLLAFRSGAFYNCSNLRKINLKTYAGSLQKLSSVLFQGCTNLEEIIWANTITTLEYGVFYSNNKLKELYLPNSITTIINPALTYMHGLEKIVFSEGMNIIPYQMCAYCENLKEIVLPNNIKVIGQSAFSGCGFEKLNLSNSKIEKIENGAFSSCSKLKEVILSNTVREVQGYAFGSCSNIEKVKLSKAMTEITASNWQTSSLKEIIIPRGIKTIKQYAFSGCSGLEKLDLSNSSIITIESQAFSSCTGLKEVIFPDTLSTLESGTFGGSYNIERVVFSKSLSVINGNNWSGNSKLKEVIIPEGVTTIGGSAFGGCYSLEKVKLPSTITTIERSAFLSCQSLKEIKIPDSVTSIGSSAFAGCTGIDYIYIPKTVMVIGSSAFSGIKYVELDEEIVRYKGLKDNNILIDTTTEAMLGILERDKEIIIPETIKILEENCLTGCANNTLVIPDNIIELKRTGLGIVENLIIGEGVTTIPNSFVNSPYLKNITLGSNIKTIGTRAFSTYMGSSGYTYQIQTITCKAVKAPTIDSYTFYHINKGGVLRVPDKTKYSIWMSTGGYYLGNYNWTIENIE